MIIINKKLISIIIPVYNCEEFVQKTLNSIVKQDFNDYEIIIVNDGSTDRSLEVIGEFFNSLKKNIDFKIISQKNQGVSAARNNGLINSRGEYIYFLDSDDYIEENMFSFLEEKLKIKKYDMLFFKYDIVNDTKKLMKYEEKYKILDEENKGINILRMYLREDIFICIGSAIYKKSIIINNNLKFNINSANGEDQEFICKFLSHSENINFIDETFFYYYRRNGSITNSISLKRLDVVKSFLNLEEYLNSINYDKKTIDIIKNKKIIEEIYYNTLYILKRIDKQNINLLIDNNGELLLINDSIIKLLRQFYLYEFSLQSVKIYIAMKLYVLNPKLFMKIYVNFIKLLRR